MIYILLEEQIKVRTFCTIVKPFCLPSTSRPFSSWVKSTQQPTNTKKLKLNRGLRVLDIIAPKPNLTDSPRHSHLRLVQDFLHSNSFQFTQQSVFNDFIHPSPEEGSISMLFRLHRQGLSAGPRVLSHALSSCGTKRIPNLGFQLHCLVTTTGFMSNVYVGSSLITLYVKCGELERACMVFDEMPTKNVVAWTAIINGFAQECQVDVCLDLYHRMRLSAAEPNEYTFTSVLSACRGRGSLGQGRSVHSQAFQMGFDSHVHIANALISMYSKCGDVEDAQYIFDNVDRKDLVSWNSMIAGYAEHGLAKQAIGLFEEMKKQNMKPDAITFLGVLSSCRHAGFVHKGRFYFNSMVEHGVKPKLDHYSCIVDLLGRAGLVEEAWDFIKIMPIEPNAVIWGSLLASCRLNGNAWVGIEAAKNKLLLEPESAACHLQLANMYASAKCWDQAARVRKLMKEKRLMTDPAYSWIEIRNEVRKFRAEGMSNIKVNETLAMLDCLVDHMRSSQNAHIINREEEEVEHDQGDVPGSMLLYIT